MIREERYLIFKYKDLDKYLGNNNKLWDNLIEIIDEINTQRLLDNKALLTCVVVEKDWPEYEQVWKLIETRVDTFTKETNAISN